MKVVVTTTTRPTAAQRARARAVGTRCGLPVLPRRGALQGVLDEAGAEAAYVVGRVREELTDGRERIAVHAGLLAARIAAGARHPLVRAVVPDGPVCSIVDGTLGLAGDALHLATALEVPVLGIEASPVVACLLEEGLGRLRAGRDPAAEAAARIRVVPGRCAEVLAALPADCHDAVFLAPMFDAPRAAAPGYALFRGVAVHDPLDPATVAEALRVSPRVVVKVPAGERAPPVLSGHPCHRVRGRAVDYWVAHRRAE